VSLLRGQRLFAMCPRSCSHPGVGDCAKYLTHSGWRRQSCWREGQLGPVSRQRGPVFLRQSCWLRCVAAVSWRL